MKLRLAIIAAVVTGAIFAITPTVWPNSALGGLHDKKLTLDPRWAGGMYMELRADTATAVSFERMRDVGTLRRASNSSGLHLQSIDALGQAGVVVESNEPPHRVVDYIEAQIGSYEYSGSEGELHYFEMGEEWQTMIRKKALSRAIEVIEMRGCGGATIDEGRHTAQSDYFELRSPATDWNPVYWNCEPQYIEAPTISQHAVRAGTAIGPHRDRSLQQ